MNTRNSTDLLPTRVLAGSTAPSAPGLADLGRALGKRFAVEREIGAGGMGQVYLAWDLALERRVALKTLHPKIFGDAVWAARFRLEAALGAGLQHPNLIRVYEILRIGDAPVLVMEYVAGKTLAAEVRAARIAVRDLVRLMALVCDAVDYAHAHGVIHCDIKPENILIDPDGSPKLGDFGIAVRGPGPGEAPAGACPAQDRILGSPGYMAPEQAAGGSQQANKLADIYSLGATLYFAIFRRAPPADPWPTRPSSGNLGTVPPGRLDRALRRDLEAVCRKAMQRDPVRRYAAAQELAEDLRRIAAGLPIGARSYGLWESVHLSVRARAEAFTLALVVLVLMGLGLVGAVSALHASAYDAVLAELRRKVAALANTAVMFVDPAQVAAVDGQNPQTWEAARELSKRLEAVRERSPGEIRYAWIMRRHGPGTTLMEYVASSDMFRSDEARDQNGNGRLDPDEAAVFPGDPYDAVEAPQLLRGFDGPTADSAASIQDQWGVALCGYAPIRDADGKALAVLGVDVTDKILAEALGPIGRAQVLALVISAALLSLSFALVLTLVVSFWRGSAATPPRRPDRLPAGAAPGDP